MSPCSALLSKLCRSFVIGGRTWSARREPLALGRKTDFHSLLGSESRAFATATYVVWTRKLRVGRVMIQKLDYLDHSATKALTFLWQNRPKYKQNLTEKTEDWEKRTHWSPPKMELQFYCMIHIMCMHCKKWQKCYLCRICSFCRNYIAVPF